MDTSTPPKTRQWKVKPVRWRKSKNGGKMPYQGYFYPGHPEKYEGDVNNIVFRSGIELRLFQHLDDERNVLKWSSEETIIPYLSPKDSHIHRYFVDAKATIRQKDGTYKTYLIEVKPSDQCVPPTLPKKPNKRNIARFDRELRVFQINEAKWEAATRVCTKKGWTFLKITEAALRF